MFTIPPAIMAHAEDLFTKTFVSINSCHAVPRADCKDCIRGGLRAAMNTIYQPLKAAEDEIIRLKKEMEKYKP